MTRKQSLATLGLKEGADLADIKRAYRRLAFALHPDLNPDVPDASRRFQEVNEAYVLLFQTFAEHSAGQKDGAHSGGTGKSARDAEGGFFSESGRRQDEARKAYARSGEQSFAGSGGQSGAKSHTRAGGGGKREDVLKDILNDPFARRVFEDIYSHIREPSASGPAAGPSKGEEKKSPQSGGEKKKAAREESPAAPGMLGKVKGWFLKQIDDEQVVRLPRQSLTPGARVRLEIQHGFAEQAQIVEITLPPEFVPGKSMRLKGMGRRIGNLRGDLYVRIESES